MALYINNGKDDVGMARIVTYGIRRDTPYSRRSAVGALLFDFFAVKHYTDSNSPICEGAVYETVSFPVDGVVDGDIAVG